VTVAHPAHYRPIKYVRYVSGPGDLGQRVTYRCPQRQKHPHPAPVPVARDWHCACGASFATYYGLMHHTVDIRGSESDHYPL